MSLLKSNSPEIKVEDVDQTWNLTQTHFEVYVWRQLPSDNLLWSLSILYILQWKKWCFSQSLKDLRDDIQKSDTPNSAKEGGFNSSFLTRIAAILAVLSLIGATYETRWQPKSIELSNETSWKSNKWSNEDLEIAQQNVQELLVYYIFLRIRGLLS